MLDVSGCTRFNEIIEPSNIKLLVRKQLTYNKNHKVDELKLTFVKCSK